MVKNLSIVETNRANIKVGLIGGGDFVKSTHLPNLMKLKNKVELEVICTRNGLNAKNLAKEYGIKAATTEFKSVIKSNLDIVMICTRHNLHGQQVIEALKAKKNVFVEKPLCLTSDELEN